MRVLGLMSGTSYDGIDVAIADFEFDGRTIVMDPIGAKTYSHQPGVVDLIKEVLPPNRAGIDSVCRLDTMLGKAFGEAAARGIEELGDGLADLVVSHGQTVFHWIEDGRAQGSLQLGQPAWIAERTGMPVVSDLRLRDIAKGGQGAPLVPMFDLLLLPPVDRPRAALNLGGIANMTVIPARHDSSAASFAYDLGPANALIDAAVTKDFSLPYDKNGRIALSGTVNATLMDALLDDPYYRRNPPKSTGKELFHAGYLAEKLADFPGIDPRDVVATLTELTARVVVAECRKHDVAELVVSGGGVNNPVLMARIAADFSVRRIDEFGIPSDSKEAYAFALLGYLTVHGVPAAVPGCTGAQGAALLGSITPGAVPLRLPEPVADTPEALLVETREDRPHDRSDDRSGDGADRSGGSGG